jgi:type II secretory pathway component GspD/PulD (secretin)
MRTFMRRAFVLTSAVMACCDPLRAFGQVAPATTLPSVGPTTDSSTQPASSASFNFENAPINTVLNYLSTAFGFVVVPETPVTGRVTVLSKQPVTSDEALVLLNTVLKTNGYAAIQQGRILKITSVDKAKKEGIPVHFGTNPDDIEDTDELITQVMPIKSMDAVKLRQDLSTLIDTDADVASNGNSNSIIITDTSSRIKRLAKIIYQMDRRQSAENDIIVRQLKFADASAAAKLILDIFKPTDQQTQNQQQPTGPAAFFRALGGGGARRWRFRWIRRRRIRRRCRRRRGRCSHGKHFRTIGND